MTDLRDYAAIVGEMFREGTESPYDGVWDAYQKISQRTVPDAIQALSPEAIRFQQKRRRAISSNKQEELGEVNVFNDETYIKIISPNS